MAYSITTFQLFYANATKDIDDSMVDLIFENNANGIEIHSIQDDDPSPVPWDCGIEVRSVTIRLAGGLGPSGFGTVTVDCPKDVVDKHYKFFIDLIDGEAQTQILEHFKECGIRFERAEVSS